jgi:hypothetical protein
MVRPNKKNVPKAIKERVKKTPKTKGTAEPVVSKEQKQVKILVEEATPDGKVLSLEERTEIVLTDREKEWMAKYKSMDTKE